MAYRNLTLEQFEVVKTAAEKVCNAHGLKTIGDFKRIGNKIVDKLESKELTFADLLQQDIPFAEV